MTGIRHFYGETIHLLSGLVFFSGFNYNVSEKVCLSAARRKKFLEGRFSAALEIGKDDHHHEIRYRCNRSNFMKIVENP